MLAEVGVAAASGDGRMGRVFGVNALLRASDGLDSVEDDGFETDWTAVRKSRSAAANCAGGRPEARIAVALSGMCDSRLWESQKESRDQLSIAP